jgi:hypothetical protein
MHYGILHRRSCGLSVQGEEGDGPDAGGLLGVARETRVAPGLLGVDPVALGPETSSTLTSNVSDPTSIVACPAALRLRYQSGSVGAPALVANT